MLPTHLLRPVLGIAALVTLFACTSAPPPSQPAPAAAQETSGRGTSGQGAHAGHGSAPGLYAVQSGPLGVVTTDAEGHLLYRSDADTPTTSACTGACTATWIPLLAEQTPELLGVDEELVGLLPRPDGGTQVTLAGWPLYRHVDDTGGLTDAGRHGADGSWFVITPTGGTATS